MELFYSLSLVGAIDASSVSNETWSLDWPFHNVKWLSKLHLKDGVYTDDDVRHLRQRFPGMLIYHRRGGTQDQGDLVGLPEDSPATQADRP